MTAIASTAIRDTKRFCFDPVPTYYENAFAPVKASANCRQGGIAVLSAGYYAPGTSALNLRAMGIFEQTFDNSTGGNAAADASGITGARIRSGVFFFACGTAADAITQAHVGQMAYIIDDQTVGLTDGGGTRSPAGPIVAFDSVLGLPAIAIGPQFTPSATANYGNPKIQIVAPGAGTTLASGTKAVGGSGGTFSLTASSVIIPIHSSVNGATGLGAQYVISSVTTGAAGTAAFTVTSTAAAGTTVTADTSILAFLIIN